MGWKIIEVNTNETLTLYLNNILIKRENEKILINLRDIDLLIMNNERSMLSTKLLNAITMSGASIIFMNERFEPTSHTIPFSGHHYSLKILRQQLTWNNIYKGQMWEHIVKTKIKSQSSLLKKLDFQEEYNSLQSLMNNVKNYDVTNREGHAAKIYFNRVFGMKFIRDQKAIKFPGINSMLNYGYAIIRSLMIKAIVRKGLDTRISFFHKSYSNFFALASDLMEPFRALVDEIVEKNKHAKIFTIEIRDELLEVYNRKIHFNNKQLYLSNAMEKMVDTLITGEKWVIDLWG